MKKIALKTTAVVVSASLLAGVGMVSASAAASSHSSSASIPMSYSGHKMWCYWWGYGRSRGMEVVPDGTIGDLPGLGQGWCKVYIDYPMYLGQFTVVAPNGTRWTYEPVPR